MKVPAGAGLGDGPVSRASAPPGGGGLQNSDGYIYDSAPVPDAEGETPTGWGVAADNPNVAGGRVSRVNGTQ